MSPGEVQMKIEGVMHSATDTQTAEVSRQLHAIPSFSVLVPIAERHDDLRTIHRQIVEELAPRHTPFEVIFVLDGPNFSEAEKQLRELRASSSGVRAYRLNRPFGEATALQTAASRAQAPIILTLAPYFQLAPGAIGTLLDTLKDGYDLVVARRHPRIDSWFNRLQSRIFHVLTYWLTGVRLHDISCGLRAMKAQVLREISLYGDLHRFIPLLAYKQGFRVVEVPFPQSSADSSFRLYGPGVYLRRLLDILTVFFLFKFTRKPLRFFGLIGAGLLGSGLLITGYLAILWLLNETALADRPLLLLGVLLMVLGVQTASLGLIGEIIVFTRARDVDEYRVGEVLD
jgi:glycosyltransferase involved in cell wall biosynthesis